MAVARLLFGVVCSHFYDDYVVLEPAATAEMGQRCLKVLHELVGFPFAEAKHARAAPTLTFLGVETDLRRAQEGQVDVCVSPLRVSKLTERMRDVLHERAFPPSIAASLAGKLQFTLSWMFGRLGRACLQPLYSPSSYGLPPAVATSLRFLCEVLPWLPPHQIIPL